MAHRRLKSFRPQPSTVTRPFVKWLLSCFIEERWRDSGAEYDWLAKLRRIAESHRCRLIFDLRRGWEESVYSPDYRERGPAVLAGGAGGDPRDGCTAALHELGHHILLSNHRHSNDPLKGEEEAWRIANRLAREYRLPMMPRVRPQALYSYRYRLLYQTPGSKRRHRRRPPPRSWKLEDSRRSADVSFGFGFYSMGKKGRRHAKKYIKRTTRRAERRKDFHEE